MCLHAIKDKKSSRTIRNHLSFNHGPHNCLLLFQIYGYMDGVDLGRLKMIKLDKILRLLHDWVSAVICVVFQRFVR